MKFFISLSLLFLSFISAGADPVDFRPDYSKWKGTALSVSDNGVTAKTANGQTFITGELPDIPAHSSVQIEFEWRYQSETPPAYITFAFNFTGAQKGPAYIWFNGTNGARPSNGFDAGAWHRVSLPASKLKPFGGNDLDGNDRLKSFRSWIAPGKPSASAELEIRSFRIREVSREEAVQPLSSLDPIRIWPRHEPVCLPRNLDQFMFIEFPPLSVDKPVRLKLSLPQGVEILGVPQAVNPALPPSGSSLRPERYEQQGQLASFDFSEAQFRKDSGTWLTLALRVKTPEGMHSLKFELDSAGRRLHSQEVPVKIYPELRKVQFKNIELATWNYPGLEEKYLPLFMTMMQQAGFNTVYNMRGEIPDCKSVTDYAGEFGMKVGSTFFVERLIDHAAKNHAAQNKDVLFELCWLLDHPAEFKPLIERYFKVAADGKRLDAYVYDSERGSYRKGEIRGDLSPYAREQFRKFVNAPAGKELTPEIIQGKYVPEWVRFNCALSLRFAALVREVIDEKFPGTLFKIYSGYEYDSGPYKDRTRELYSTDWKTILNSNPDSAGAGYGGSMELLQHTARVISSRAAFIPAEMYIENFASKFTSRRQPELWSMRLIEVFMNSGMNGMSIWYANDLDGSALIAINRLAVFMKLTEDYATAGKRDDQAIEVSPKNASQDVYLLRQGGNAMIIALNTSSQARHLRLNLKGFNVSGYTGELAVIDKATGRKIPAAKIIPLEIPPNDYRILELLDDGN